MKCSAPPYIQSDFTCSRETPQDKADMEQIILPFATTSNTLFKSIHFRTAQIVSFSGGGLEKRLYKYVKGGR